MYPVVLNLCHDPHSLPQHPSPSLPPQNRRACPPSKLILIGISQNRPEVWFCAELGVACALCDAKVGRWGHPPNFVRPSIEEEQKFGGWICQRWVSRLAVVGIVGRANVLRKCKIGWKYSSLRRIGCERAATVKKSGGRVILQTLSDLL